MYYSVRTIIIFPLSNLYLLSFLSRRSRVQETRTLTMASEDFNYNCPLCFLVFPQDMLMQDRTEHITSHYVED